MSDSRKLADRFREVMLSGTWIANTNFKHQLQDLDWKIATKRMDSLNTIAILAQHIHYYVKGVKQVLEGGELDISDRYSFDFPEILSQEQWEQFLSVFWKDAADFAALVEKIPPAQLNEDFVKEQYGTYLRNIDGMIEHCYYHLGQIVLIRKILNH